MPWPLAVLLVPLFWLMPRRFGPHFAQASWTAAIVAHGLWGAYAVAGILLVAIGLPQYTLPGWLLGCTPEQDCTTRCMMFRRSARSCGPRRRCWRG